MPIRLDSAADGLTVVDGRVTGVRMADGTTLPARKGVVLATGGYEWNAELMRGLRSDPADCSRCRHPVRPATG